MKGILIMGDSHSEKIQKVIEEALERKDITILTRDNIEVPSVKDTLLKGSSDIIEFHQSIVNSEINSLTKAQKNAIVIPVRAIPKIPRNAKCPCGSNRKYKHCCINGKSNL